MPLHLLQQNTCLQVPKTKYLVPRARNHLSSIRQNCDCAYACFMTLNSRRGVVLGMNFGIYWLMMVLSTVEVDFGGIMSVFVEAAQTAETRGGLLPQLHPSKNAPYSCLLRQYTPGVSVLCTWVQLYHHSFQNVSPRIADSNCADAIWVPALESDWMRFNLDGRLNIVVCDGGVSTFPGVVLSNTGDNLFQRQALGQQVW